MSLAKQGKRTPPTFQDAGNVNKEEELKEYIEPEELEEQSQEINEPNLNTIDSIVDAVVHAPKEKPKKQVSIYLDEDVVKAFEKFGKKHGKGARSELVNNFLKKALNV